MFYHAAGTSVDRFNLIKTNIYLLNALDLKSATNSFRFSTSVSFYFFLRRIYFFSERVLLPLASLIGSLVYGTIASLFYTEIV